MDRRRIPFIAWCLVCSFPTVAVGQVATPALADKTAPAIVGTNSWDIISLGPSGPAIPLRHGNVVAGSEQVQLEGLALTAGVDYVVDNAAGVIYLMRAQKEGQSLSVSYRYTATAAPVSSTTSSSTGFSGPGGFKLALMPGSLDMHLGFGMAERGANGSVAASNLMGWNNNFGFGGTGTKSVGGLTGIMLFGTRSNVREQSLYETDVKKATGVEKGSSRFVLESLKSKFMGGSVSADYQDISKNFTGFSNALGQGIDQPRLDQLTKEKGLNRLGFGLTDMSLGGLKLSDSYKEVKDTAGTISWRTMGLKAGDINAHWSDQAVDSKFSRFADLSEADKALLQRQLGMKRQVEGVDMALKGGALNLSQTTIQDSGDGHLYLQEAKLASKNLNFDVGTERVESKFTNFGGLLDAEKASYGADGGLRRQYASLKGTVSSHFQPFAYEQHWIKSDKGDFKSSDTSFGAKTWSLTHSQRAADKGFVSFASINAADTDANTTAIGAMYSPTLKVNAPAERGAFDASAGLSRESTRLTLTPNKYTSVLVDQLSLKGQMDSGQVSNVVLASGNLKAGYRSEDLGARFNELGTMMSFERANLGTIAGLKRTDISASYMVEKGSAISVSKLDATTPLGGATREQLTFKDKKFDISLNERSVDPGFTRVNELVDPENALLQTMVGLRENDNKIKITNLFQGLNFDGTYQDSVNRDSSISKQFHSTNLLYQNKTTSLGYTYIQQHDDSVLSSIFASSIEQMSLKEMMGKWGTFHYTQEKQTFDPNVAASTLNNANTDFSRETLGVDVKVSPTTTVSTEQISTDYVNGQHDSTRNDSISTAISKRAGISLTDTKIDHAEETTTNQVKRNYGFWYDFGKGLRVSYGYVRQLDSSASSTLNSNFMVGTAPANMQAGALGTINQGTVGDVAVGGGYAVNQWQTLNATSNTDAYRTQSFSNIRLNTVKPFALGVVKDIKLNLSLDTAADNFNWIRENRQAGMAWRYGTHSFSVDYHSQMNQAGDRAIDRSLSYTSDAKDERFLSGNFMYKVRTLPFTTGQTTPTSVMVRNYGFVVRPTKLLALSNQLSTNPEVAKSDAILGSVTQGARVNKWKLDFKGTKDTTMGASWEELINTDNKSIGQTSGLNLTILQRQSPITFFYGVEDVQGNVPHKLTDRWSVKFDQRAGPNQSFGLFFGNVSYGYTIPQDQSVHNLTANINYQLRF